MTPAADIFAAAALTALGAAAALILRRAWRRRDGARPWLMLAGWGALAAAVLGAAPFLGPARGPFMASALVSFGALAVVAASLQKRTGRSRPPREVALEPSERASKAWRGWLRVLLAGPLGGIAAMGVGLAWTVWVPGPPQTRIVLGGLLVPILWAAGMAWTLADDKILRATAVLSGVTLVTFTAAVLKGFS
ncbi:hypothetical protein [Phenylobacterium sp.]|uniref:hypothetical protein n=1 Tax=Phenylobacterium sp. TaxID=1871053 RepID=UPI0030014EC7